MSFKILSGAWLEMPYSAYTRLTITEEMRWVRLPTTDGVRGPGSGPKTSASKQLPMSRPWPAPSLGSGMFREGSLCFEHIVAQMESWVSRLTLARDDSPSRICGATIPLLSVVPKPREMSNYPAIFFAAVLSFYEPKPAVPLGLEK